MSKQTEAQRLASMLTGHMDAASHAAAAELLRQEALIAELAGALESVTHGCRHANIQGIEAWHEKTIPTSAALDKARAALANVKQ